MHAVTQSRLKPHNVALCIGAHARAYISVEAHALHSNLLGFESHTAGRTQSMLRRRCRWGRHMPPFHVQGLQGNGVI